MATASSDAFDPALSVEDGKGKVLAKNDDREEGDQSPFVVVRFPEDGTYLLKVLSYRSVSGGKFTARLRRFTPLNASLGEAIYDVDPNRPGANGRVIFRLPGQKGKVYDLQGTSSTKPYAGMALNLVRIVGPTGVDNNDAERIATADGTPVFEAKTDGDFYLEYQADAFTQLKSNFRVVATVPVKSNGSIVFPLAPNELKIVEMPVVPDLIVRSKIAGTAFTHSVSGPEGPSSPNQGFDDSTVGANRSWTWFLMNRDDNHDVVRVFHGAGTVRFAVRGFRDVQTVTLSNTESLPEWSSGKPIDDKLGIGDVRLYLIHSAKSELMKVFAKSPSFQTQLDIFRLNGERANTLMDRRLHQSADDLYFPDPNTFIVRLVCDGYGGSGPYTMRRETLKAMPYTMGAVQTITLDGANFGLYEMNLEAGKRYEFLVDNVGLPLRVDLLDEDGQFLNSPRMRFDKVEVLYFTPTRSGRHRLWLRGANGTYHFKFEPHKEPTVGSS